MPEGGKGAASAAPFPDADALIWASRLVVRGINVVPLVPGKKIPATKWKYLQDVRMIEHWSAEDLDRYLCSWWPDHGYGLGVLTGATSNLLVVDVDDDAARELVVETCGGWPRTTEVATGRDAGKGVHLYFSHYGGDLRDKEGVGGVKLDARGDGGIAFAPPSVHPSGVRYRWKAWTDTPFPPMPEALRELIWPSQQDEAVRATQSPRAKAPRVRGQGDRYAAAALEREAEAVRSAPVGDRNSQLNRSAYACARFAPDELSAREIGEALLSAAIAAGLPEHESKATLTSAFKARWSA